MTAAMPVTTLPLYEPGTCHRWTGTGWCGSTNIQGVWQIGPLCRDHAPAAEPVKIPGCDCPQCR